MEEMEPTEDILDGLRRTLGSGASWFESEVWKCSSYSFKHQAQGILSLSSKDTTVNKLQPLTIIGLFSGSFVKE